MTETERCTRCNKPLQAMGSGIVTQFIETCQCDLLGGQLTQTQSISICSICSKRIPKNVGTMTEWIFGKGRCECNKPRPLEKPVEEFISPAFQGFDWDDETELSLDPDNFPVERYTPVAELGHGATGIVYLCKDTLLKKPVAVKTLKTLSAEDYVTFQKEAKATAKLRNASIIKALDFGTTESGTPYMVMEYVPGISLETYIKEQGTFSESMAQHVFTKLARALEYAHRQGIYHRDIKPSNILLSESDIAINVCLIDFGIAAVKEVTGSVTVYKGKSLAGTPAYMSPDVVSGGSYDQQSEIYSLGCVLFEALTGKKPFTGETALEILSKHAQKAPPKLSDYRDDLPERYESVIANCLAKEKSDRFRSMLEFEYRLNDAGKSKENQLIDIDDTIEEEAAAGGLSNLKFSIGVGLSLVVVLMIVFYVIRKDFFEPEKSTKSGETGLTSSLTEETASLEHLYGDGVYTVNGLVRDNKENLLCFVGRDDVKKLTIRSKKVRGDALHYLRELKNLKTLKVINSELDRGSFQIIASMPTIKVIELTGIENLGECLEGIDNLSENRITLRRCVLTEKAIVNLANQNIQNAIEVDSCPIDESAFLTLPKMRKLLILSINNSELTREQMETIGKLKGLSRLKLDFCKLKDPASFDYVTELRNLTVLSMELTNIDRTRLEKLSSLKKVRNLYLTSFSKGLVSALKSMNVEELTIKGNLELKTSALFELASVNSLKQITVIDCPSVNTKLLLKKFRELGSSIFVIEREQDQSKSQLQEHTPAQTN